MPAITVARDPAERRRAVAADPDRRMRPLHRLGQAAQRLEAVEVTAEAGGVLRPQRLEDLQVLVADRAATIEVRRAERLELLAQPAHADTDRQTAAREHVERRQHLGG